MAEINIDFKEILPFVIEAFTEVYGKEYKDIIFKKITNAIIIPTYSPDSIKQYILYIKSCKRREYAVKFLSQIGIDVNEYTKDNYTQPLDDKVEKILEYFIGSSFEGFGDNRDYWAPLHAFKMDNKTRASLLLINKIKIINFLLSKQHELIDENNFALFAKTKEYCEILKKIDSFNKIYEQLFLEYKKWEEKLKPYEEYVEREIKRQAEILKRKKISFFEDIVLRLPSAVRDAISNKSIEEQSNIVLGYDDTCSSSLIEAFSLEKIEELKNKDVSFSQKRVIIFLQMTYLNGINHDVFSGKSINCSSQDEINQYLLFLKQDSVKKYIPSIDLISYVNSTKNKMYEEAIREYYETTKEFINAKEYFGDKESLEYAYSLIREKIDCICFGNVYNANQDFVSLMFYTIRENDGGALFYFIMHECGHIIDNTKAGCGFEPKDNTDKNPYNETLRKYERFNETLNDIFTNEAIKLLHNRGIYLVEPKEFTLLNLSNINTFLVIKNLLKPLVVKYRKQVIKAKINGDANELIQYIGKDNFEKLVDIVNKVDYLASCLVATKQVKIPNDEMFREYFEQVQRVYDDIDSSLAAKGDLSVEDKKEGLVKKFKKN